MSLELGCIMLVADATCKLWLWRCALWFLICLSKSDATECSSVALQFLKNLLLQFSEALVCALVAAVCLLRLFPVCALVAAVVQPCALVECLLERPQ